MTAEHAALRTEQHYFEIACLAMCDAITRRAEDEQDDAECEESPTLTFDRSALNF